jgi:solute:Na+ symporter, SSS family
MIDSMLLAFVGYLCVVACIGIGSSWFQKSSRGSAVASDEHDFMLGGRSTHWLLTALSAHAADMSDWLFMGLPAAVFLHGGTQVWIPIGLLCGMFGAWQFVARPLRLMSAEYGATTLASFFQKRYADTQGYIGAVTALISFFFFVIYISVGLKGIGYVLQSAFGIHYHFGIGVALAVILTYLMCGGFASVALLDLFQGIFLLVMLLLVPIVAYFKVGGWPAIFDAAAQQDLSLALLPDFSLSTLLSIFLNPFAWCLGYFGMPHILTKFMGSANAADLHKAKYVGVTWQLLATGAAVAVGMVSIAYFQGVSLEKPELIFVLMAKSLFTPFWAGVVLCAIVAATISTVDSQLLVLAGIITEDFYKSMLRPAASAHELKRVYTGALVMAASIGFAIAWHESSTIMGLVRYAWAGLGASFGPLMLVALYGTYANKYGALAGIITGAVVAATWDMVNPLVTSMQIYAIVPAYVASLAAIHGVSWLAKPSAD